MVMYPSVPISYWNAIWYAHLDSDITTVLKKLEKPINDTDMVHIFSGDIGDNSTWKFDFSEISKRRFGRKYWEITSYDPDGRNLDFFNPVNYSGNVMVLFEDYGAGIMERFLLEHRVNLKMRTFVVFEVDGVILKNTTTFVTSPDKNYPLKQPFFRPDQEHLNCGYYVTFPIAYQQSIRITAQLINRPVSGDKEIWEKMINCKKTSTSCPLRGYFAITCNKLVQGVNLQSTFQDYYLFETSSPRKNYLDQLNNVISKMANAPENYTPGLDTNCELKCYNVGPGEEVTIFSTDVGQVIQSMLLRIYDEERGKYAISNHWERIFVTMTWDGREPQVKEIPSAFFTVGIGYLREVNSLMAGMRKRKCSTRGNGAIKGLAELDWVAHLYYEMPFWTSARIGVKRSHGFGSAVVCAQINTKQMDIMEYNPLLTGYFSAQLNRYESKSRKHKTLLHVENEWGHVVAINLIANAQGGSEENDVIIETNNATAPIISGTGLEDYFGYTRDFKRLRNTSSVLAGVPYYLRKNKGIKCMHMYRHMILDPILFTKGVRIYIEGSSSRQGRGVPRSFEESSSRFNETISDTTVFSVALFYGRKGPGGITSDKLDYGQTTSASHNVQYSPGKVDIFKVQAAFENQPEITFIRYIVSLKVKQRATHTFKTEKNNAGVILRREYRSVVPNQKAKVEINGRYAGIWFCPQRAISDNISLRIDDYNIHPRLTVGKETIDVTFEAITLWESSSIEVISVML